MKIDQGIINIVSSYEKSRVILTACELDLFTQIHQKIKTAEELADKNDLNLIATKRLLDCLVTFELLIKKNHQYTTTDEGSLLSSHSSENILPLIKVINKSWNNWHHLTEIVKKGCKPHEQKFEKKHETINNDFIELMHILGRQLSFEIAEIYDLSSFSNMLDIGGASGTYTISFLKKNPKMTATLFDLEDVLPLAEKRLKSEGLLDRVELKGGNFNKDLLPENFDLVLLSDIIGLNTNEQNLHLFNKIYKVLNPNGVLLIRDFVMDESNTCPAGGALFSMLMLVETQGVGAYSFLEYNSLLKKSGFSNPILFKRGEKRNSLIEARK